MNDESIRRPFRFLHAALVVVCLACLVQWLRSNTRAEATGFCRTTYFGDAGISYRQVWVQSGCGSFGFRLHTEQDPGPRGNDAEGWIWFGILSGAIPGGRAVVPDEGWSLLGFRFYHFATGRPGDGAWATMVMVPWALPALLAAAVPARAFGRHYRSLRRAVTDRCRHCGFNLAGGTHRCPECGGGLFPAPQ